MQSQRQLCPRLIKIAGPPYHRLASVFYHTEVVVGRQDIPKPSPRDMYMHACDSYLLGACLKRLWTVMAVIMRVELEIVQLRINVTGLLSNPSYDDDMVSLLFLNSYCPSR